MRLDENFQVSKQYFQYISTSQQIFLEIFLKYDLKHRPAVNNKYSCFSYVEAVMCRKSLKYIAYRQ